MTVKYLYTKVNFRRVCLSDRLEANTNDKFEAYKKYSASKHTRFITIINLTASRFSTLPHGNMLSFKCKCQKQFGNYKSYDVR